MVFPCKNDKIVINFLEMELLEIIKKRRNYRGKFQSKPIAQADIEKLIEAARWAPSPFNTQPWELILIDSDEKKIALAEIVKKSIIEQLKDARFLADNGVWMRLSQDEWRKRGDGVLLEEHVNLPDFIKDKNKLRPLLKNAGHLSFLGHLGAGKLPANEFAQWVQEAPLLILVLMNKNRRSPGQNGSTWMLLGMGAFIQNLHLQATVLNIGVQYVSAPLETKADRQKVRELFSIPPHYECISLLRLGYLEVPLSDSVRLDASEFVHCNSFDDCR